MTKFSALPYSIVALLALLGCSTTSKKNQLLSQTQIYTEKIYGVSVGESKLTLCRVDKSEIKATQPWKSLVTEANHCVQAKQWDRVEKIAEALAGYYPLAPWGLYYKSLVAEGHGQLNLSFWLIEQVLSRVNTVGLFYLQKSRLYLKTHDMGQAVEWAQKAVKLDSRLLDGHLFLGTIFLQSREYSLATRHFEFANHLSSRDVTALTGLAECRLQLKDSASAVELLSRAAEISPQNVEIQWRLAHVLENVERDYEQALRGYRNLSLIVQKSRTLPAQMNRSDLDKKIRDLEVLVAGRKEAPRDLSPRDLSPRDPANDGSGTGKGI